MYAAAVGVLATLGVERAMAYCGDFASPFQIAEASAAVPTIVGPNICSPGTEATIFGCQPEIAQLEVSFFNEDGDKASVCAEDENGGQCPIGTCVDNINTNFGVGTTPYAETGTDASPRRAVRSIRKQAGIVAVHDHVGAQDAKQARQEGFAEVVRHVGDDLVDPPE